ncbi:MAG: hypothetical protein Q7Q73_14340 [Verrucomicrobiota bacterium JB024]|nr:hypothetical protein [Verrucomicrobiota bacterium JB024]
MIFGSVPARLAPAGLGYSGYGLAFVIMRLLEMTMRQKSEEDRPPCGEGNPFFSPGVIPPLVMGFLETFACLDGWASLLCRFGNLGACRLPIFCMQVLSGVQGDFKEM